MIDRKLNIIMVLFSAAGGVAGHFLGNIFLQLHFPRPLQVSLYMGMLGLCIVLGCVLAETLFPIINGMNWKRRYMGITWRYLVPAALLPLMLIGGIMQLIYQIDLRSQTGHDVYMLIDRSGSMEWNDPTDERLAAVMRLIETFDDKDRVEIITFDHRADVVQPLTETATQNAKDEMVARLADVFPDGGTDFNNVLGLTFDRIQANKSEHREPIVIMLSDGESELDAEILTPFLDNGIKVNTVGLLLDKKDGEAVLYYIARRTFGQFVMADNTGQLDLAFTQIYQPEEKFILNRKTSSSVDGLQWLMYILSGFLIGLATGFIFDNRYIIWPLAAGGSVGGLLAGALLCEPVDLLLPAVILGFVFTLFTLFSKTPPPSVLPTQAGENSFLDLETDPVKKRGQFH